MPNITLSIKREIGSQKVARVQIIPNSPQLVIDVLHAVQVASKKFMEVHKHDNITDHPGGALHSEVVIAYEYVKGLSGSNIGHVTIQHHKEASPLLIAHAFVHADLWLQQRVALYLQKKNVNPADKTKLDDYGSKLMMKDIL